MSIFYFPSLGSWDFVACVLYVESERAKRGEEKTLLWSSLQRPNVNRRLNTNNISKNSNTKLSSKRYLAICSLGRMLSGVL